MRLDRTAIIRYIKKCKNVIECNCVTGDYSMLLEVLFENTMELDRFIGELQYFGRTKTLIVFSTSVEHRGVELLGVFLAEKPQRNQKKASIFRSCLL